MVEKNEGLGEEVSRWLNSGGMFSPRFKEWLDETLSNPEATSKLYGAFRSHEDTPEYLVREALLEETSLQKFDRSPEDLTDPEFEEVFAQARKQEPRVFELLDVQYQEILKEFGFEGPTYPAESE